MPISTNKDAIKKWSQIPKEYLKKYGEEGDLSKKYLLNPAIFKLLEEIKDKSILEVGSGTGYLCRLMAKKGAVVTGIEPGESMYEFAVEKEHEQPLGITYLQKDLSELTTFNEQFNAVVANMVFLDIPDYKSSIINCIKALKNNGIFIFSLSHPCFFSTVNWEKDKCICIKEYFEEYSEEGTYGTSYHRTLSTYLNFIIKEGCEIKEIIEPHLTPDLATEYPQLERDVHVPSFIVIKAIKYS